MREFNFRPVPHNPFSPDLTLSEFCLFCTAMARLRERSFQDAGEHMEVIGNVTGSIRPTELDAVFRNWEDRLQRCIELGGENVD
jgi:hypothetical protein